MMIKTNLAKAITMGLVFIVLLSGSQLIRGASADGQLNLPSDSIFIEVFNGTQSFFSTNLIGVPSGYDVANGTYLGWCVDQRTNMTLNPATHEARLFSSTNPPEELANEQWQVVNYILNHKQGEMMDIQQAIWYFVNIDGNYTPTREMAWTIVNDTLTNGGGFMPSQDQILAIICYPLIYSHQEDVQVNIIEVINIIPEFQPTMILPLFMLITFAAITLVRAKKKPSRIT